MIGKRSPRGATVAAAIGSVALVLVLDLLTNSIDLTQFDWDSRYYLDMAEGGMGQPLASPFAYRYITPLLARLLAAAAGQPAAIGFWAIAYFGAIAQLLGTFLFTRWYTKSVRGAWMAMLVVAFSLFNAKFLLFDPFRPDHLAYPLVLLQAYLALTGQFRWLLASTMLGCQIREFAAVPLLAYLYTRLQAPHEGEAATNSRRRATELVIGALGLGAALILPRMLIPVSQDFQFATLTRDGVLRALLAPFILARDANFLFSIAAYLLPILMLASPRTVLDEVRAVRDSDRTFFGAYAALVLGLSFLGGTDFFRFSTYLLVPQSVILGLLAERSPTWRLGAVLLGVLVFNRIWLPIPVADVGAYLDFYGAHGTRFNASSVARFLEWTALVGAGLALKALPGRRRGSALHARA